MGLAPLIVEVIVTFFIAASILYRYGNWYRHHLIVTGAVLIAWYFSMLIVFILPLDVSNTIYWTCIRDHEKSSSLTLLNGTLPVNFNSTTEADNFSSSVPSSSDECPQPWSLVPDGVFPVFWRIVYWTSQFLTWLILPLMQSFTRAGEFNFTGKLRSALIDNAIYYGSYLLIVGILLLYVALRPDISIDGSNLRPIAASASNTWGLFWLVLLLGYGLVEVPRSIWHSASTARTLNHAYFHAAKLSHEQAETKDHVRDLLHSMRALGNSIGPTHPLRANMDLIESKVPSELLDRIRGQPNPESPQADVPSEKALVRLHKQLIKALQNLHRVETQWSTLMSWIIALEDTNRNFVSHDYTFKHSVPPNRHNIVNALYTPMIEWLWRCRVRGYLLRCAAVCCAIVSVGVVWSELTFFNRHPTLSLFAIFVNLAKGNHDFFTIEILSSVAMAYVALCAYSTLFRVRVLNFYYLAPHHQTDEYSLIFSGMMLCRLTPPMCLNFLSLIHMDSHVIKTHTEETHYTQIMGHMDVISIISDGFNIYFPMMIVALCLATYYSLGSRLLSALGFQQFLGEDDLTGDLIDEGKNLVSRESRRRQRMEENASRRQDFVERFGGGESSDNVFRSAKTRAQELLSRPSQVRRADSTESAQLELLAEGTGSSNVTSFSRCEEIETGHIHTSGFSGAARYSRSRPPKPDTTLFDDV